MAYSFNGVLPRRTFTGEPGFRQIHDDRLSVRASLRRIAVFLRVPADVPHMRRELALNDKIADCADILRAAQLLGLRARVIEG